MSAALAIVPAGEKPAAPQLRDATLIKPWLDWRNASLDVSQDARRDAERDEDYYNGTQLTADEIKTLKRRGQPYGTFNMIRRKVDYILGAEKQTRTDPKCFPREQIEEDGAEFWTDALRYAADRADFPKAKSKVTKRVLVNGFGGAYIGVEQAKDGTINPVCKQISWDRIWHDPHSCEPDFSDARYVGFDTWYDEDEAIKRFPNGRDAIELTPSAQSEDLGDTYDDKPKWKVWADTKRKRVRVSELYYREDGIWHYACFTRGGELEPSKPVTYLDENGEPECPLVLVSAYVDRDNNRHGMVRDLVPVQDEINKRRQKALHLVTMRQARVSRGASVDGKAVSRELAKPDGLITADKDEFEILPTNDMAAANLGMLEAAKADMQLMGPNAAAQGKDPRNLSGKAQALMQNGAMTELTPILESLRDWQLRVMRQFKNRIKQFWTGEMVIRVTDDERNVKFVGLNQQTTMAEMLIDKLTRKAGAPPPPEVIQEIMAAPDAQQMVTRNNIAATDVDIIIDEQPDVVTLQAETFETLAKLAPLGGIPPDVLIEAAPLPSQTKRAIQDKMEAAAKQGQQVDPAVMIKAEETKAKIEADAQKQAADMKMREMELMAQAQQMAFEREKMSLEIKKLELQIASQMQQIAGQREMKQMEMQDKAAERGSAEVVAGVPSLSNMIGQMAASGENQAAMIANALEGLGRALSAPKALVRGPDGRAIGVQSVG